MLYTEDMESGNSGRSSDNSSVASLLQSRPASVVSVKEVDSLVEALGSSHMAPRSSSHSPASSLVRRNSYDGALSQQSGGSQASLGTFDVADSGVPIRPVKVEDFDPATRPEMPRSPSFVGSPKLKPTRKVATAKTPLRVLIVEVRDSMNWKNITSKNSIGQRP
jgi:hypothetical protein